MSDDHDSLDASAGCLPAMLCGVPIFFILLYVDALGDCPPEPTSCEKGFLLMVLLPTIAIMGFVFGAVRAVLRSEDRNRR